MSSASELDALIPRIWAASSLKRYGIEPTKENIDAFIASCSKQTEEDLGFCGECGRPHEE